MAFSLGDFTPIDMAVRRGDFQDVKALYSISSKRTREVQIYKKKIYFQENAKNE